MLNLPAEISVNHVFPEISYSQIDRVPICLNSCIFIKTIEQDSELCPHVVGRSHIGALCEHTEIFPPGPFALVLLQTVVVIVQCSCPLQHVLAQDSFRCVQLGYAAETRHPIDRIASVNVKIRFRCTQ